MAALKGIGVLNQTKRFLKVRKQIEMNYSKVRAHAGNGFLIRFVTTDFKKLFSLLVDASDIKSIICFSKKA